MIPIYEWLGGKARHAEMYGYKLMAKLPDDGIYYEGFAGAASIAIFLGTMMPKLRITLTDSNPCVINALKYIKTNGDFRPVFKIMARLVKTERMEDRKHLVEQLFYSEDPIEWLAAANSVRPAQNAWPYPPEKIVGRMSLIPAAWKNAKKGLQNAEILNEPMAARACHAAYFDPPYYGSTFAYYAQKGDLEKWLLEIQKTQRLGAQYILASDNKKAARFYALLNFSFSESGKKLNAGIRACNVRDEDGFFEWERKVCVVTGCCDSVSRGSYCYNHRLENTSEPL